MMNTYIALLARRWKSLKALTSLWFERNDVTHTLLERSREDEDESLLLPRHLCTRRISKHNMTFEHI